jgi:hypothetical protein
MDEELDVFGSIISGVYRGRDGSLIRVIGVADKVIPPGSKIVGNSPEPGAPRGREVIYYDSLGFLHRMDLESFQEVYPDGEPMYELAKIVTGHKISISELME